MSLERHMSLFDYFVTQLCNDTIKVNCFKNDTIMLNCNMSAFLIVYWSFFFIGSEGFDCLKMCYRVKCCLKQSVGCLSVNESKKTFYLKQKVLCLYWMNISLIAVFDFCFWKDLLIIKK